MATPLQPDTFADMLQRYRRAVGLTQEQLAERAHLSARGISNLERGVRRLPQRGTVTLLVEALGLHGAERAAFEATARGQGEPVSADPPTRAVPTNLPLALTSFVGREQEIATVRRLLGESHLLTLTGAGGCGKTRLALEVARTLLREAPEEAVYADGIWLVELAALSDGAGVPQAVATSFGVRECPGQSLLDSLIAFLRPKQMLLLLDNCEHLVLACAELVEALLRVCPHLTILATSREALGIAGEQPWRVPSLALPDPRGRLTLEQAAACEAVQLFAQRAQVVRPDFALREHQVILAAQVCRRLDGIPLAIELAAARLSVLALDQLAARLDDRFRLLTGGSRTALPRQQTIRATLDWSYDLLSEAERLLLRRLSVFAGGWVLEAAEAVCAGEGIASEEVLDLLAGLVNKSLALLEAGGTGARYRLLETVRHYGLERLTEAGELAEVRGRYLDWCVALAEEAEPQLTGPDQERWLARLEGEHDNLRTALRWTLEGGAARPDLGLRLVAALERFWRLHGHLSEGRQWCDAALARSEGKSLTVRAKILAGAGALASLQGDLGRAAALHEESPAANRALGDTQGIGRALNDLGVVAHEQGDLGRAASLFTEVLALARALAHRRGIMVSLTNLGEVVHDQGDLERAAALHQENLALSREQGDTQGIAGSLANLAEVAHDQGDLERAATLLAESLRLSHDLGDTHSIAGSLANLGRVAHDQGDLGRAAALLTESLRLSHNLGARRLLVEPLEGLVRVSVDSLQPQRAARLGGFAQAMRETLGVPLKPNQLANHDLMVEATRAALGGESFMAAWAAGRTMELEEAIAYALQVAGTQPH